jgi:hypothetical protein
MSIKVAQSAQATKPAAPLRKAPEKYEKEANDAARRIMHGERAVGRSLTPTTAAAFHLPSSPGEPLGAPLLHWLEAGFSADLTPLRLYRCQTVDRELHRASAEAFTASTNIYVRSDRFDPAHAAGKELIAHEVAHVLQQSGRKGSKGITTLSTTAGRGPLQFKRTSPLESTDPVPTFDQVCDIHQKADTAGDALLRKVIVEMKKQLATAQMNHNEAIFWDRLESDTKSVKAGDLPQRKTVSFYFDLLKSAGRFEGATNLIEKDPKIRSAFFSAEFYQNFPDDSQFINTLVTSTEFFAQFPLSRFADSLADYLNGPSRAIPNLGVQKDFNVEVGKILAATKAPGGLIENDLMMVTLWAVEQADRFRRK